MVKDSHSNNGARTVYMGEKMHLDPYPMLYIKIKLKWVIDSCKSWSYKAYKGKQEKVCDFGWGKGFSGHKKHKP